MKPCFASRWQTVLGEEGYSAMVDGISYTFYGYYAANGDFVYDVYLYNPEENNNKLLKDYTYADIRSGNNKIVTQVYRINTATDTYAKLGTENKEVTSHLSSGARYNVIRDKGTIE